MAHLRSSKYGWMFHVFFASIDGVPICSYSNLRLCGMFMDLSSFLHGSTSQPTQPSTQSNGRGGEPCRWGGRRAPSFPLEWQMGDHPGSYDVAWDPAIQICIATYIYIYVICILYIKYTIYNYIYHIHMISMIYIYNMHRHMSISVIPL